MVAVVQMSAAWAFAADAWEINKAQAALVSWRLCSAGCTLANAQRWGLEMEEQEYQVEYLECLHWDK